MTLVAVLPVRQAAVCMFEWCKVCYPPCPLRGTPGECASATSVPGIYQWPTCTRPCIFTLYTFTDDVNWARTISSHEDGELLQAYLNSLCNWARQWKISFKVSKCAVLQCMTGKTPPVNSEFELNGVVVKTSEIYKDPGVFFTADLSFPAHYNYITSRAYRMLRLIRQTFSTKRNIQEKKSLYISVVHSQLLYCSVLWRPKLLKDIEILEWVQRQST